MPLSIGDLLPTFTLPATDGASHSSGDLAGEQATVVLFWCNHCPYVQPNQHRVIAMQRAYADKGVRFCAICSNRADIYPQDDFEHMRQRAIEMGYNFPYLRDEEQDVARDFGAQRTPEAFLFDQSRRLAYHGRIDDNYQDEAHATSHDLRDAIDAVLNHTAPRAQETGAVGCSIKWK
jgi:peroxiredoxin